MARNPAVDAYIAKSAAFARPVLEHLRALVHRAGPDVVETIKWSMPTFEYAGKILCHLAAFKAHCAFGFWHQGMDEILAADGVKSKAAAGHFGRITRRDDLPPDATLLRYVKVAMQLNKACVPARTRGAKAPKPEARVPAELAAALEKNKRAAKTFAALSPSHRRQYIAWIVEAKREETRQKRLATAIEWLAAGKVRNWKYESC